MCQVYSLSDAYAAKKKNKTKQNRNNSSVVNCAVLASSFDVDLSQTPLNIIEKFFFSKTLNVVQILVVGSGKIA